MKMRFERVYVARGLVGISNEPFLEYSTTIDYLVM
jgi:hypothetical protein